MENYQTLKCLDVNYGKNERKIIELKNEINTIQIQLQLTCSNEQTNLLNRSMRISKKELKELGL